MSSHCPDRNVLQSLLSGQLASDQLKETEQHLETCPSCEQQLEQLTDEMSPVDWKQFDRRSDPDSDTIAFLSRVRAARRLQDRPEPTNVPDEEFSEPIAEFRPADAVNLSLPARFDSFELIEQLGAGGMGVVYRVRESVLKRDIALKLLAPQLASEREYRDRFLREARAMAAVQSDHVVTVYQVGEFQGQPYLAMPLLEGESLRDRLRREKSLALRNALQLAAQIASGLAAAHERGLIHRDVKPANIWLEAPNDRVKLLDFGLAHIADDSMEITASGAVQGTPKYMSPEQALACNVDHRTDLYSLGCVLYQMLTGTLPTEGATVTALLIAITTEDARDIRDVAPELPEPVAQLVMSLLRRDAATRPQTATEVAQELRRLADSDSCPDNASDSPPPINQSLSLNSHDADRWRDQPTRATKPVRDRGPQHETRSHWQPTSSRTGLGRTGLGRTTPRRTILIALSVIGVVLLAAGLIRSLQDPSPDISDAGEPSSRNLDSARNLLPEQPDTAPATESSSDWITVFDGETLDGWTVHGPDHWTAENGVLTADGPGVGWLMLDRTFEDYVLELEYRLPNEGASGLFPRAWPDAAINGSEFIEIQILDDAAAPFENLPAREKTGSLFAIAAPNPTPVAPANQWNRLRVTVRGSQIVHEINGVEVLNHDVSGSATGARRFPASGQQPGHIGLQYYRTKVEFRNLRVRAPANR